MRLTRMLSALVPLVAACNSAPVQPVPMRGAAADIAALAGEWDGTYESDDGERRGSIDFHVRGESDTAFGDVVMIPQGFGRQLEARERRPGESLDETTPPPLLIRFVAISGGEVSGEMESYFDPVCGCRKTAVFRGRLTGDTLRGKYHTYRELGGPPDTGTWRAERKPPKP